ncbi:MAG: bifunctional phosphopantothenoylcysteine decarboxylase/phosphopantothenate--cysteine ligase CoaBC [Anaerolineales bacterium]|nr:bifunctional phosphopantothenoylcysteine decarboxylase/phosphopantothenate--cysteine ligase CoaBC [Anaerolineales bacterium]
MSESILEDRRIMLGVTGSIAAYKAVDLASKLTQGGARVDVILTDAAQQFVAPLSFQSVTGERAYTDEDLWGGEAHVIHVGLAQEADLFLIAPITANTIAKLAHGHANSLLTVTALAIGCPLVIAPAMDAGMFEHPATQANLAILKERGVWVVGPVKGRMASGLIGMGRMVEPEDLVGHVRRILGREGALAGRRVVVTAGGTQEPVDPVRVLANRSSGKQGFALAQAALDRGAEVILISAPTHLTTPVGAERIDVTTAAGMLDAVMKATETADVLLMAAAVADFRPIRTADEKLKRRKGVPEVDLEPTEDILAAVAARRKKAKRPELIVGFAAESEDLLNNARAKLEEKGLSLIVANDITASDAGFAVDTNRVTILDADGGAEELPLMRKTDVAEQVLRRVVDLLND